jgi:hypothetical protein
MQRRALSMPRPESELARGSSCSCPVPAFRTDDPMTGPVLGSPRLSCPARQTVRLARRGLYQPIRRQLGVRRQDHHSQVGARRQDPTGRAQDASGGSRSRRRRRPSTRPGRSGRGVWRALTFRRRGATCRSSCGSWGRRSLATDALPQSFGTSPRGAPPSRPDSRAGSRLGLCLLTAPSEQLPKALRALFDVAAV